LQSGCHNKWSSKDVTSSPRKFQTDTDRLRNVRNSCISYRKIKADGVTNSLLLTSVVLKFLTCSSVKKSITNKKQKIRLHLFRAIYIKGKMLTSRIWRFSPSCFTRSFSLNCSMKSTFLLRWRRCLNDFNRFPSSIERISRGIYPLFLE
jgi:hypothetical protein